MTSQAATPTSPGGAPAVDPTPEQRIKQWETQLREQVRAVRTKLPRLGTRKVLRKITAHFRVQGLALDYLTPTKSISKEKAPPENPSGALA